MPAYQVQYPGCDKPRMIEAPTRRTAIRYAARSFSIETLSSSEVYDLTKQGIELEATENGDGKL